MLKASRESRAALQRVLHLGQASGKPGEIYYPLQLKRTEKPVPGDHEVLVQLKAAALNHRDLFVRQHQYPAISLDHPMLSDGTAQDYVCVHKDEVVPAPKHLSATEGAALPLVGLTAWRALVTKAAIQPGQNVLITGIGGGVALSALQFGVAMGANVFVTSGSQEKLLRARDLGARGGAIYKLEKWEADIRRQLPSSRPFIDAVIDGAGGDIVVKAVKLLKPGGVIVQYGMTVSPKMNWTMPAVLLNAELKGTTMGSRQEFRDMVAFVDREGIRPVISRVVQGLSNLKDIDGLFDDMKSGRQMGALRFIHIQSSYRRSQQVRAVLCFITLSAARVPISTPKSSRSRFLETSSLYLYILSSHISRLLINKTFIFTTVASILILGLTYTDASQIILRVITSNQRVTPAIARTGSPQAIWNAAKTMYSHLDEDKFTIAMLTYRRPKELNYTLSVLLKEKVPSLHEIVVIWGDADDLPPANFTSKHGVPVRFRRGLQDSLNEKF
ncbi:alcohol dehydrogenase [Fusarium pseudoanthophilum]|uniref:Alcohol dehydrogenase n=1 Tax=Fusarium pseudoanthophilum TaxID=48495 RepID=A0A8H5V5H3_9HYPO|nr:alcohol dehydrogenase [Fusarium pseudoanthophilum]